MTILINKKHICFNYLNKSSLRLFVRPGQARLATAFRPREAALGGAGPTFPQGILNDVTGFWIDVNLDVRASACMDPPRKAGPSRAG
jgi:hypothetical protein